MSEQEKAATSPPRIGARFLGYAYRGDGFKYDVWSVGGDMFTLAWTAGQETFSFSSLKNEYARDSFAMDALRLIRDDCDPSVSPNANIL